MRWRGPESKSNRREDGSRTAGEREETYTYLVLEVEGEGEPGGGVGRRHGGRKSGQRFPVPSLLRCRNETLAASLVFGFPLSCRAANPKVT
ncbi:unnamed protein product [Urochloa humidicola]